MPISAPQFLNKKIMESFSPEKGLSFVPDLNIATDWDLSAIYKETEDQEQRQNPAPTSGALAGQTGLAELFDRIDRSGKEQIDAIRKMYPEVIAGRIQEAQAMQKLGIESIETAYKNKYMYDTLPKYAIAAAVAPNMFLRDVVESPLKMTGGHRAAQIGLNAGAANEPRVQI
jgi:hypothetical protein